jgi:MFS family permease
MAAPETPVILGYRWVVVVAGVAFGFTAPLTAILAIGLGANPLGAGLVVASMQAVTLSMNLFGTRWFQHLEPRRALCLSLVFFGIGSAVTAVAPSPLIMALARAFQGLGTVLFTAVGPQLAIRTAGSGREGQALGGFNAAWFLGISVGSLAGAVVVGVVVGVGPHSPHLGLRAAFAVCALISVVGSILIRLRIPRLVSSQRPSFGWPSIPEFTRPRAVAVLGLAGLGQALRSGLAMTLLPLIAAQRFGLEGLVLGLVLTVVALADVLAMHMAGVLADRVGRLPTMTLGVSLGVLGAMVAFHAVDVRSLGLYVAASALLGTAVGTGWVVPSLSAVDLASSMATGLSAYRIAADIGMGLGSIGVGGIASAYGIGGALAGVVTVLVVITVLTAFIGETMRGKRKEAPANRPVRRMKAI